MKLLVPRDGTKIVIEGTHSKSGKTALGALFTYRFLEKSSDHRAYGNISLDHPRYKKVDKLTPGDFKDRYLYVVLIDELDRNYPYQKAHWNEGLLSFWGFGASHNRCAVIATVQREYAELEKKYLRHYHIVAKRMRFNSNTGRPYAVRGDFIYPFQRPFAQNVEQIIGKYDPWEKDVGRIIFSSFAAGLAAHERKEYKNTFGVDTAAATVVTFVCPACGHSWEPRKDGKPKRCPGCYAYFKKKK